LFYQNLFKSYAVKFNGANKKTKVNKLEESILKALLDDPRTPFSQIAKQNGVTSNTIRMIYKRLRKTGVITGTITQVNPSYFGYNTLVFIGLQTAVKDEKNVIQFLEKISEVIAVNQSFGKFNISLFACLKNIEQLSSTVAAIRKNPEVIALEPMIWISKTKIDYPENLIIKPYEYYLYMDQNRGTIQKESSGKDKDVTNITPENSNIVNLKIDKTDIQIIKELLNNARISFRKLAEKIGVSTQTIIRRYYSLKGTVITHSSITIDLSKLGYVGIAVLLVKTSQELDANLVLRRMVKIPNVIVATRLFGNFDFLLIAPMFSIEQIFRIKNEVGSILGVQEIEFLIDNPFFSWPLNLSAKIIKSRV